MTAEKIMVSSLTKIFGLAKVTFDKPGESNEQRGMFIAVDEAHVTIRDAREIGRFRGTLTVYAPNDEMPYGYFQKKIAEAPAEVKAGWFFGDEEPAGTFRNIVQRRMDFQFLFDGQYDPAIGKIETINLEIEETL